MLKNNDWKDASKPWKYEPYSYSNAIVGWVSNVVTGAEVLFALALLVMVSFCIGLGVAWLTMKDMIC